MNVSKPSRELSRQELYEKVWQTPITLLARQYGLSDVGLAKICKRNDIPRPPRGYWAKKSAGMKVKKTPLPQKKEDIVITISPKQGQSDGIKASESLKAYMPILDIGQIVVPKRLTNPHPLIEEAITVLEQTRPNENELLESGRSNCLNIKVSSKILSRTMRIMDTLLKTLNKINFDVNIINGHTVVVIDNIEVAFGIREELETEQALLDTDLNGSYSFHYSRYKTIRKPSGRLCLSVQNHYSNKALRKNWRDTQYKRLEYEIEKIIIGFIKIAADKKERIRQREEEERQYQEMLRRREDEARRKEELRSKIAQEQKRVSELIESAENWHKSKLIRGFISTIEEMRKTSPCNYQPDCSWDEWIVWAKSQADRLDPLRPSPPSILDEDIETDPDELDSDWDDDWY
jgi:hypothetical protein